jgi:hypothetical protein
MAFDPDKFLEDTTDKKGSTTFDPDEFLSQPTEAPTPSKEYTETDAYESAVQTAAPIVSNLVKGPVLPTPMTPGKIIQGAADVAAMAHGHPPYGAMIRNAMPNPSMLIQQPLAQSIPAYAQALKQMPAQALNRAKAGAGTVLRGAGKLAGPVGLGMNALDAAQYAQEAELGQRLAQGQGKTAQQNYRGLNTPINGPISPEEAQALIESGSPRDIAAAGGQARINALVRQKAAELALRPIAPQ